MTMILLSSQSPNIALHCQSVSNLGKGSDNQNGNLGWILPLGGVSHAIKVLWKKLLKIHLQSLLDCQNAFFTYFELYIMYI